ncbi:MAG: TRAP transporter substrate-binding protein DctP [Acidobacteria bacterium]|nr:TRAP transporter substrate-binding protein DctP [Acidobacteriota bacterium]
MKRMLCTLLLLAAITLATTACSSESAGTDTTIRWRAQAGVPASSWAYQDHFTKFVDLVSERSKGRLEIEIFPPGTIVDAYEQFTAVQRKAIEVGMGVGGYNVKQVPEAYIEQGLFGVFSTLEDFVDFYIYYKDGAVYELIDAAYREKGCHLLKSLGPSPLVFISREPLNSVEELKGLKIRGSGAAPDLITNLGAVPVTLAPVELYMALQTGTVDAVIMPNYTIGTINLWDVAKGLMGPPFGQVAGDIYVNLEAYNSLPDDLQEIVEEAAEEAMLNYVETISGKMDEILKIAEREHGVTIVTLPDEEYAKIMEAAAPILDQTAARSPRSKEIIRLMREYLAEKGKIGTDRP